MLKPKHIAAYAQLRQDLIAMDLAKSFSNKEQFSHMATRIKHSLAPAIWHDFAINKPITEEYAIMMNDPVEDQFMILLVLWPGQMQGSIHNHNTWSAIGVLRGLEENVVWNKHAATNNQPFSLEPAYQQQLHPGEVCVMTDTNIIHSVNNLAPANQISMSIHVYGDDLRETDRKTFDPINKIILNNINEEFISLKNFMDLKI